MSSTTLNRPRARLVGLAEQIRFWLLLGSLTVLLILSITLAVVIGPVSIPMDKVWQIIWAQISWGGEGDWTQAQVNIVWLIRFPRVLLAVFVGAGLAVVGVAMQAVVRNPLADPYILGVSAGASVGAVLVLGLGWFAFIGVYAVSTGAFLGALVTFVAVFLLAQHNGRLAPSRLILSGVACAYVFSGITSLITLTSDNRELARSVLAWLLGSLAGTGWIDLTLPVAVLVLGSGYLTLQARALNALLVGDETAATLGVNVNRFRRQLLLVMSLLTGVMVAVSGAIGFVGLMIPHMVRMGVGTDHRRVLPVSVLAGSIFLIWVDVVARTAFAPIELPVGVITSLLGGPFFIWLMHLQRKSMRDVL
ncbi:MAG: iron ABC transporter permease [Chloroflexi bacterium]|nr:iron ABC transporter permease [Chloroflexota bacterium]